MNTPGHLIINAAVRKRAGVGGLASPCGPFLLGAVLPDIPLTLLWIASNNSLHAPVLLLTALTLLWRSRGREGSRLQWWFWFLAGCLVHSALDIPMHVTDGPLLLVPFEWSIRFHSPVSYWDPRYRGRQFAMVELLLDLALLAYLSGPATARWLAMRRAARAEI